MPHAEWKRCSPLSEHISTTPSPPAGAWISVKMIGIRFIGHFQQSHGSQLYLPHSIRIAFVLLNQFLHIHTYQLFRRKAQYLSGQTIILHPLLLTDFLLFSIALAISEIIS